jgi:phage repressor protein C with HTH and peptisase S24 domain
MELNERIRAVRKQRGLTQLVFAEKLNMSADTVQNWEYGKSIPSIPNVHLIAETFKISAGWLLTGEGEMLNGAEPARGLKLDLEKDFVYIPMLDVSAAAGDGAVAPDMEIVSSRLAFRRDWIKEQGISPDHTSVIHVVGDSMFPTLINGDVLLVDRSQKRLIPDKIYVFRESNNIIVKRFRKQDDCLVTVSSDNQSVRERVLDFSLGDDVIGRVVWVARKY